MTPAAAALDALPLALAAFGPDGAPLLANAPMLALLGGEVLPPWGEFLRRLASRGVLGEGPPAEGAAARTIHGADGRPRAWSCAALADGGRLVTLLEADARPASDIAARELRAILDGLHTGVGRYDAGGVLRRANPAFARLLGLPEGLAPEGQSFRALLQAQSETGELPDADIAAIEHRVVRERARAGVEWRHERTRPNGSTIRFANTPLPEGGWQTEVTDITAERGTEQEAQRRAALHAALIEALPVGVALYGPDRRVALVNEAYNRILEDDPVQVGDDLRDILLRRARRGEYGLGDPEDQVAAVLASLHRPQGFERRRPGGGYSIHRSVPLPDGGHAIVVSDISALHAAQNEARSRAAVLDTMLESTRHGIVLFDPDGRVVAANRLAARLAGVPMEAFRPGASIHELRAEQVRRGVFGDARSTTEFLEWRGAMPLRAEDSYRRTAPGGVVIEVATDVLPGGGFVRSYTDVTALVNAEREAKQRAEELGQVLDTMRHGIIMYDAQGFVITGNRLGEKLSGLAEGALRRGRHFDELRGEQVVRGEHGDAEAAAAYVANRIARPWEGESTYQRRKPDGTVLEIRTDLIPGGGVVRSFTDITALARAQEEAERRAATQQVMLENIRHGLILFDAGHRVAAFNALAARLTGLEGELRLGLERAEMARIQAAAGEFGDAATTAAYLSRTETLDYAAGTHVFRRTRPDGTELEAATSPVAGGGFVLTLTDITGQLVAQREAQERAAMLEATMEAARTGITIFGPGHRVLAANAISVQASGVSSAEEAIGLSYEEVWRRQVAREHPQGGPEAEELLRFGLSLDRTLPHHYERRRSDGAIFDVRSDPRPDGGFVISISDVTELATAREAARRQAAVLEATLNATGHALFLYGADGRLVAANGIAAQLCGFGSAAEMTGRSFEEILLAQFRREYGEAAVGSRLARVLRLDRTRPQRYQRPLPDGRVLDVSLDPAPGGGFAIAISDVTALVQAEAEAKRRNAILSDMLGNIRQGVVLFDAAGRIAASNPRIQEMLGVGEQAFADGMTLGEMVDALLAAGEYGEGEAARATAEAIKARDRSVTQRSIRARGDGAVYEVVSDPTPGGGFVVTYTDVTEDRRVRAELERARAAAEGANLAKSRFLATMSHELRTPLNAVIGFSEVLAAGADPRLVPEYAGAIEEAGRHLLSLIDDILDITRAEEGRLPVARDRVPVAALLRTTRRMMAGQAAEAGLELSLDAAAALPAVSADSRRLRQVLLNLLANAIKFTPRGGRVTLSAAADAEGLRIEVGDTGIGIAREDMGRLFQPFAQVESAASRRYPGSGLGLYLCRVLLEAQGGTLTLESEEGRGTLARIAFPPHLVVP
ncbi:PAS-domain containing protein [Roseococcus sp. DSY-14]|uniref:PAS-domain containing protein n=1 Tax=Roseococcus sp. DSY-14 TaxID=3369650 RepID=UPI00387B5865